ncbi:sulfotransferase [Glycomyces sp. TRM65418]|uniref:sulfotransferase n=1 Tax=Glycomyces sp. TRM65418 TaxID=2867006 RepID=UPI001D16B292|nr:sulfotransferase [Glycomyces sp. TRM65418]MCC3764966.1 sulfotransferase [Glycomyces sp. TRM65418]
MSAKIADTAEQSENRVKVVFIGGLGRSGTTLLERLLGQLPGVVPLGEITHLWERDLVGNEMCACGATFSHCEFWQRIGHRAFGSWEAVDVERLTALKATVDRTRHIPALAAKRLAPAQHQLVTEYAEYFEKIYTAAAKDTRAQVVVDSSKHASLAYCLRWSPKIDLRVLHVVRDSRGVAYSWTKQVRRPESPTGDQMTRYSPAKAAMLWNAQNAAFSLLARRGVPVRRVRYERIIQRPRKVIASLGRFCGLDLAESDYNFIGDGWADLGPSHSAAGNPMRFTVGRIPIMPDEAWTEDLPEGTRRMVSTLTRPLLGRYGYLDEDEAPAEADPAEEPAREEVSVRD